MPQFYYASAKECSLDLVRMRTRKRVTSDVAKLRPKTGIGCGLYHGLHKYSAEQLRSKETLKGRDCNYVVKPAQAMPVSVVPRYVYVYTGYLRP